jgi:hypothetical protein
MLTQKCVTLLALLLGALSSSLCAAQEYKTTFLPLARGVPGLLYEPASPGSKASIAVLVMHPNDDNLTPGPANACVNLAKRGYRALCANTSSTKSGFQSDGDQDKWLLNVKAAMTYLRNKSEVKKVVLFGHSGGGAMMASYQNIAEHGLPACQGPEKLIKCSDALAGMPPADGVMLIDSSLGTPGSVLLSIDPAVADEDGGQKLDPALDIYNPANGYQPKGSHYSDQFKARFFARQAERMNRLIAKALARLAKIEAGQGRFTDDEPFVIAGAAPVANKLNSQDLGLAAHTRNAWPLLHADGRITNEIVRSVRVATAPVSSASLARGSMNTTVRHFLSTFAVRAAPGYGYDASNLHGIDYHSSYAISLNGVEGITKPLLQMGMTGSYEFFYAETLRDKAASSDKTLAYVEGAVHGFTPCTECALARGLPPNAYGDTVKTLYDYMDAWLSKPGRFQ